MNTHRFQITLPKDLAKRLAKEPNKSALIAESLRMKFKFDEAEKRKALLAQAYKESSEEDNAILEEWDQISGEGL